jgi:hypothetical protein
MEGWKDARGMEWWHHVPRLGRSLALSAPQDFRITNSSGSTLSFFPIFFPSTNAIAASPTTFPCSNAWERIVVNGGKANAALGMSSYPMTATSSGMESPASRRAVIAPIASVSFPAKRAVGATALAGEVSFGKKPFVEADPGLLESALVTSKSYARR